MSFSRSLPTAAIAFALCSPGTAAAQSQGSAQPALRTCATDIAALRGDLDQLLRLILLAQAEYVRTPSTEMGRVGGTGPLLERFSLGAPVLDEGGNVAGRAVGNISVLSSRIHDVYKDLKQRRGALEATCTALGDSAALDALGRGRLADVDMKAHQLLDMLGRLQPLSAVMRSALSIADVNEDGSDRFGRNSFSNRNEAAVVIEWETKHYRDEESAVDFSLGGSLGFAPIMSVVSPRETASTTTGSGTGGGTGTGTTPAPAAPEPVKPLVAYQSGFTWDVMGRANLHAHGEGELAGYYRVGMTRLSDFSTKLGDGDAAKIADVVPNGTGRWAVVDEVGLEYRLYDGDLDLKHDELGLLSPMIRMAVGVRWDRRFRAQGVLADLDDPTRRYFFRFGINIVKLLDQRREADGAKTYGVRFAADREWGAPSSIPSGTRLLIEADANILKLIRPAGTAPPQTAPPAGGAK